MNISPLRDKGQDTIPFHGSSTAQPSTNSTQDVRVSSGGGGTSNSAASSLSASPPSSILSEVCDEVGVLGSTGDCETTW
jgi:hypothetical protein